MDIRCVGRLVGKLLIAGSLAGTAGACGGSSNQFASKTSTSAEAGASGLSFSIDASLVTPTCNAKTCSDLGYSCGKNSDGCDGVIDCGTCASPSFCGGGGYSKCGTTPSWQQDGGAGGSDAASSCVPKTCADLGYDCGYAGDGCGNSLNCGGAVACSLPAYCGGGGPQKCGGDVNAGSDGSAGSTCTPKTCADLGYDCGFGGDGCGNSLDCGGASACAAGQYCGGGGANKCGGNVFVAADGGAVNLCTPTTCATLGYNCGPAGDGCGNLLMCGTSCPGAEYCGGAGPNKCGGSVFVASDGGAVNLCWWIRCFRAGLWPRWC